MIRQAKITKVPFDYNGSKSIPGEHEVKFDIYKIIPKEKKK